MPTCYDRRTIAPDNLSFYSQVMLQLRPGLATQAARWGSLRAAYYARRLTTLPVPVISLGNITFGGTGKTPLTLSLAQWLVEQGYRPGILTNGYGGRLRKRGAVVTDGTHQFHEAGDVGEESVLLARALKEHHVPVAAGADREAAAQKLLAKSDVDVLILDDGYQYTSIARDTNICVVDATNPFGAGGVEDYGWLREEPEGLKRATAILLSKVNLLATMELPDKGVMVHRDWILEELGKWARGIPVIELPIEDPLLERVWHPAEFSRDPDPIADPLQAPVVGTGTEDDDAGVPSLEDRWIPSKLLPICALGNPEAFEATCRMAGLQFNNPVRYEDHAPYSLSDVLWWNQIVAKTDAVGIVVSSKDWVKMFPLRRTLAMPCYVLTMKMAPPDWGAVVKLR